MEKAQDQQLERITKLIKTNPEGINIHELINLSGLELDQLNPHIKQLAEKGYVHVFNLGEQQYLKYHDPQEVAFLKQMQQKLNTTEFQVYESIFWAKNQGIEKKEIGNKTNLSGTFLTKILNQLVKSNYVKAAKNANKKKGRNIYIRFDLELTENNENQFWYKDGDLNVELIDSFKQLIIKNLNKNPNMTLEQVANTLKQSTEKELELKHVQTLINSLLFEDVIEENKSIIGNSAIYKLSNWDKVNNVLLNNPPLTKTPCGNCPLIKECQLHGNISPQTCIYFENFSNW